MLIVNWSGTQLLSLLCKSQSSVLPDFTFYDHKKIAWIYIQSCYLPTPPPSTSKNCAKDGLSCPSAHVERLCFEMDKTFKETKLQLLLSPCVLLAKDCLVVSVPNFNFAKHIVLSQAKKWYKFSLIEHYIFFNDVKSLHKPFTFFIYAKFRFDQFLENNIILKWLLH